jgi:hypothetical protein
MGVLRKVEATGEKSKDPGARRPIGEIFGIVHPRCPALNVR